MKFRKDNKYKYGQDHAYFCGLPHDIDFSVERFGERYTLTAYGYGQLEPYDDNSYGNGKLYIWGLNSKQRARFERVLKEAQPLLKVSEEAKTRTHNTSSPKLPDTKEVCAAVDVEYSYLRPVPACKLITEVLEFIAGKIGR